MEADAQTALGLYRRAAEHDVRIAQANLALILQRGSVERAPTLDVAWDWYLRSTGQLVHLEDEACLAEAHTSFVEYLATGEAASRYGGHAHYLRGLALQEGLGVAKDLTEAAAALGQAARAVYPEGQGHITQDAVQRLVSIAQSGARVSQKAQKKRSHRSHSRMAHKENIED